MKNGNKNILFQPSSLMHFQDDLHSIVLSLNYQSQLELGLKEYDCHLLFVWTVRRLYVPFQPFGEERW